ncbi:hypothetical protein FY528_03600 [Hymenobacter lutimineralis]|uniref:Outer membrane beta-barrel protein n=1 Tax=Hymenobacter lutimineralis TaxID=2606448 RepID=A0A5D6VDB6_9BACT|nr:MULTISPECIES: hypothetical protein [Hymenobacter]QIX61291.1 hypothetical protein HER32_08895 [Hymenobacter sp. BT18]TYZ13506.1 hypothetical protein FY528_03600 [Hymenobacter lutimineralis]
MNFRFLLVATLAAFAAPAAVAQSPNHGKRHYNHQSRPYYRGPVRFTFGGGITYYNGDLTGSLAENFIGPAISAGVLYKLYPGLQVGGEFTYFQLGAKDQLPSRGLAFRGRNASLIAQARLSLLRDPADFSDGTGVPAVIKPYLRFGVGALLYSPESYQGTERPTSNTNFGSPERNDYPATALIAPVGLGLSVRASRRVSVALEGTYFFTTTDHLDDVSTRANPARNDGYGLLELKAEYALRP